MEGNTSPISAGRWSDVDPWNGVVGRRAGEVVGAGWSDEARRRVINVSLKNEFEKRVVWRVQLKSEPTRTTVSPISLAVHDHLS